MSRSRKRLWTLGAASVLVVAVAAALLMLGIGRSHAATGTPRQTVTSTQTIERGVTLSPPSAAQVVQAQATEPVAQAGADNLLATGRVTTATVQLGILDDATIELPDYNGVLVWDVHVTGKCFLVVGAPPAPGSTVAPTYPCYTTGDVILDATTGEQLVQIGLF